MIVRKRQSLFLCLVTILLICAASPIAYEAAEHYPDFAADRENTNTGYQIYLDDWGDLLNASQEESLLEYMEPISQYGNVAFVSISENPYSNTAVFADQYFYDHFAFESGVVFVIDMDERYLWIYSNGEIYETITTAYANTITDNVYTYASDGDYYTCASIAFEQIYTLLEGRPIAQPMKYISNALLAVVIALLLNYFIAMLSSRAKKANTREVLSGIYSKTEVHNTTSRFIHQTRRYVPRETHSGGKGGHSGGGGGGSRGGGGGHRGGGGGHRF